MLKCQVLNVIETEKKKSPFGNHSNTDSGKSHQWILKLVLRGIDIV